MGEARAEIETKEEARRAAEGQSVSGEGTVGSETALASDSDAQKVAEADTEE